MAYAYVSHTGCSYPTDDPFCPQLPPPPPPPPYSDADNGTRIQIRDHHPNRLTISFLIAAGSLLGISFLLLLLFAAVLRRRRRLRRRMRSTPPLEPETDIGDGDGEGDTHHVWYIRTVGLEESIIASIASAEYKSGAGGDCAVCLGEFVDGEMVKLLPKCAHTFHVSCIDTWLRGHVNCPVCRAPVLPAEPTADPDDARLDIPDSPSASSQSATSTASSLAVDLEDKGFQPVRRSVSVDSSTLATLLLRIELQERTMICDRDIRGKERDGFGKRLGKSQSTRSGRFFFARGGRSRSNSILPL